MIVSQVTSEHRIFLVTSQGESLSPMVAVIKTILQHSPELVLPYEVMSALNKKGADLVIIDMQNSKECLPLIRSCKEHFQNLPVIAMVPYGDVGMVENVMKYGADDYISQPISLERLKFTLRNALRLRALLESRPIMAQATSLNALHNLVGAADKLRTLKEIEDAVIDHAIASCEGCITQAAKALGIGRSTLYRKMQDKVVQDKVGMAQISRENQTTRPTIVTASAAES